MTAPPLEKKSRERGPQQEWLDAADDALIEGGVDNVRIVPLSKRLERARTGVCRFFPDREALAGALPERWQQAIGCIPMRAREMQEARPTRVPAHAHACTRTRHIESERARFHAQPECRPTGAQLMAVPHPASG